MRIDRRKAGDHTPWSASWVGCTEGLGESWVGDMSGGFTRMRVEPVGGKGGHPRENTEQELKTVLRKPVVYGPFWNAGWVSQPLGRLHRRPVSDFRKHLKTLPLEVLLEWLWPVSDRHGVKPTQPSSGGAPASS